MKYRKDCCPCPLREQHFRDCRYARQIAHLQEVFYGSNMTDMELVSADWARFKKWGKKLWAKLSGI